MAAVRPPTDRCGQAYAVAGIRAHRRRRSGSRSRLDASIRRQAARREPRRRVHHNNAGTVRPVLAADNHRQRELGDQLSHPLASRCPPTVSLSGRRHQRGPGWVGLLVGASYGVSKAALWSATESMRTELAPRGVQVVGVYVGLVDTDMASFSDAPKSDPADVVRQVLDGIESGAGEVLADELTRQVRAQLGTIPAGR